MSGLEAVILGFVQGLTEFLPVSSSGHLMIGRSLLGLETGEDLVFETVLHAGTVLSTLVVFRKQIGSLLKGLFRFRMNDETDYILKIVFSMVPVFVVGMFFKDEVEAAFGSLAVVGVCLLVTALLLFFSDRGQLSRGTAPAGTRNGLSWKQAFIVGLGQACAVLPGLSRSGTTIATGLLCGVKREVVAQFSFLMVIVPILGETFLDLVGGDMVASSAGFVPLVLGFASAFASGLLACKAMIALVKKAKLKWFALYCFIVGTAVLVSLI